jgi:hypothetical protein
MPCLQIFGLARPIVFNRFSASFVAAQRQSDNALTLLARFNPAFHFDFKHGGGFGRDIVAPQI